MNGSDDEPAGDGREDTLRVMRERFGADPRAATVLVDGDGRISFFDRRAEELTGFAASDVLGRAVSILSAAAIPLTAEEFVRRVGTDGEDRGVLPLRLADGTARLVAIRTHRIRIPDEAHTFLLHLLDVSPGPHSDTHPGLLDAVFHQSPYGVVVLDEQLRFVMINQMMADANRRPVADHLGRHVREVFDTPEMERYESLMLDVMRTGKPVFDLRVPGHPTSEPGSWGVWSASWFRVESWCGSPLGICGIIYELPGQAPFELDRARTRERSRLLSRLGALQGATLDMEAAATGLVEVLTTEFCELAVIDVLDAVAAGEPMPEEIEDTTLVQRLAAATRLDHPAARALIDREAVRPVAETNAFSAVLADGQARLIRLSAGDPAPDAGADVTDAATAADFDSAVIAPMRARNTMIGALTCLRTADRDSFDEEDLDLVQEVANRTALAIDNARLYREEKQAALLLQLSLLPQRPPETPEASMAYRYLPSRTTGRVGGDWFDTIVLPGRRIAMVVGDVVGHGINAAATMGRYRTAVQALSSVGLDPAALLTRLNDVVATFGEGAMATCLYVLYDPHQHRCVVASAGHPPLIMGHPDGSARPFEPPPGPMLGVNGDVVYASAGVETPPGTRLLLYSDGLVESRTLELGEGVARLVRRLGNGHGDLSQQADLLLAAAPDDARDDRTLLLAELHGLRRDQPPVS
ncbi:SpoIIE family protein phosphatase [Phytomonospora endophytica]|uniref:PAS domain S-box-containing protein n=1 Tax=Phytomonospora endophytica TaxID=714109 RepID=A0A841FPZ7_9ACTN|nr:SpoIIE family protein phosphatase [Phytomonospora endophytica]MBB6035868.1 PAS domain S-box-containing protein [Phytomonospora endophytica]GIG71137.1 membrane protein [Phytomonospora endophytica]